MLTWITTRLGILDRLRAAWKDDIRRQSDPLRGDLTHLVAAVKSLEANVTHSMETLNARVSEMVERQAVAEHRAELLRHIVLRNEKHHDRIARLPVLLNSSRILAHVRAAIDRAPLEHEPFPHAVVEDLLPADLYEEVVRAIPPKVFFGGEPRKQNLRLPVDEAPALTCRVWGFVEEVIARDAIVPAVIDKFRQPLRAHYATIFGPALCDRAEAMPQAPSGGRIMLRRAGYRLAPHRDPKRSMVTCLMYLATKTDQEQYGTEIYRVSGDRESSYMQTYYPEQHGARCELVKVVPFRANSMLVFVNSGGAHGARIPDDAPPELERYSYQFYVGPGLDELASLIGDLPPDRQAMWRERKQAAER
jgi:hypothetical protein